MNRLSFFSVSLYLWIVYMSSTGVKLRANRRSKHRALFRRQLLIVIGGNLGRITYNETIIARLFRYEKLQDTYFPFELL